MKQFILCLMFCLISATAFAGFNICDDGGLSKRGTSPIDGCLYFNDSDMDEYNRVKTLWAGTRKDFLKINGGVVVEKSQGDKDIILAAEAQAVADAQDAADDEFQVTLKEAFTAWIQVYNSKIPAQYQVTKNELVTQIKNNR